MSNAGSFNIYVSPPYPCWCELRYEDKPPIRFSHKELSDLKYAVEKAMQEAICILPESDRHEVKP